MVLEQAATDARVPFRSGQMDVMVDRMRESQFDMNILPSPAPPPSPTPPPVYLGADRPAAYALPYGYVPDQEMPLIISMHGYGGNSRWHDAYWGMSNLTRELGILLITLMDEETVGATSFGVLPTVVGTSMANQIPMRTTFVDSSMKRWNISILIPRNRGDRAF